MFYRFLAFILYILGIILFGLGQPLIIFLVFLRVFAHWRTMSPINLTVAFLFIYYSKAIANTITIHLINTGEWIINRKFSKDPES